MSVSAVSTGSQSANDIRTDYMRLLVTQLQNQDPLEPMDNNQMASQLAQLSELEQLENMNSAFRSVLATQQRLQATALIGKQVSFFPTGSETLVTGRVEEVKLTDLGVQLRVQDQMVDLDQIESIQN